MSNQPQGSTPAVVEGSLAERGKAADVGDAWAKRAAADVLQRIADSEPTELSYDAQEKLAGTPMEHLYCLEGSEIERAVHARLSDAFFDGEIRLHE